MIRASIGGGGVIQTSTPSGFCRLLSVIIGFNKPFSNCLLRGVSLETALSVTTNPKFTMRTLTFFAASAVLIMPMVTIEPTKPVQSAGYELKQIPSRSVHHGQSAAPRLRFWESTSGNWSGYGVPLEGSGVSDAYSQVSGTWTVPSVTGAAGRGTTYSSVWVGIDGYSSATVEQIGTEHDWANGKPKNYAWFEMYPNPAYQITGFPVNAGDSISAQVVYLGETTVQTGNGKRKTTTQQSVFQLTIVNNTRNSSYTVPTSYTTIPTPPRSSAEWVVEAPSSGRILPLANYGTVNFSDCSATGLLGGTGSITNWPADPLTMIDPSGGESDPSALSADGTAFSTTYK